MSTTVLEKSTAVGERLLTVRQVADRLGVSTRQVWKLTAAEKLPAPVRLSRSVRWRANELDAWIKADCPARNRWKASRKVVRDAG